MDVIHTMYQSEEDYFNNDGITFKEQMMNDSQFKEITICARINLDYFSAKEKYIRMFRLSDGKGKEKMSKFPAPANKDETADSKYLDQIQPIKLVLFPYFHARSPIQYLPHTFQESVKTMVA